MCYLTCKCKVFVSVLVLMSCTLLSCNGTCPLSGRKICLTGKDFSPWRDTAGWQVVGDAMINKQDQKLLASKPGSGILLNGPVGKAKDLYTKQQFGDAHVHVEFMISQGSNSGVYLQGQYEIQVYDTWRMTNPPYPGIECGGIYERWDENRSPKGYEGYSPRVNAARPPGQWQTFDMIFRAARFDNNGKKTANARIEKVTYNGVVIHENVELSGPTRGPMFPNDVPKGPLRLQGDHGPVAYRNIWICPLD